MDVEAEIGRAIALRDEGRASEARVLLERLVPAHPEHARLRYQLAWTCDSMGAERDAIPH